MEVCAPLDENGILNAEHTQWPLFDGVIYGDKTLCTKLSKRLVCGVKHLPLRLKLSIITDTQKAIENGIAHDPTLLLSGKPLIEGLVSAEAMTAIFETLLSKEAL
jgi:hypothetical protein